MTGTASRAVAAGDTGGTPGPVSECRRRNHGPVTLRLQKAPVHSAADVLAPVEPVAADPITRRGAVVEVHTTRVPRVDRSVDPLP
jgi:hypothetical protein